MKVVVILINNKVLPKFLPLFEYQKLTKSVPPVDAPTTYKMAQIMEISTPCTNAYTNNESAFSGSSLTS
jgi:hypothetical protein